MPTQDQEKNSRQTFLSIVSHELKTPITSIQGFIQALQRKIESKRSPYSPYVLISDADLSQYNGHLNTIQAQVKRLNKLVDDILDISVLESGQLTMNWQEVNLPDLLAEICNRLQMNTKVHSILYKNPKQDIVVSGDPDRLEKVFSNLILNSIKYSPNSNKIEVTATVENGICRVSIKDFGIGIYDDEKSKIFDLYFRGKNVNRNKVSGLGLGLYLSKQIVDLHKGSIGVDSVVGKGSTFFVDLPIKSSE
jgi:signal transduction histidine kinase